MRRAQLVSSPIRDSAMPACARMSCDGGEGDHVARRSDLRLLLELGHPGVKHFRARFERQAFRETTRSGHMLALPEDIRVHVPQAAEARLFMAQCTAVVPRPWPPRVLHESLALAPPLVMALRVRVDPPCLEVSTTSRRRIIADDDLGRLFQGAQRGLPAKHRPPVTP